MLRVIPSKSSEAAQSYFTEGLAKGDYYAQGQEIAGRWGGKDAPALGLTGEVTREAFAALTENRHPKTGGRLTLRTKSNRVVGWDLNFHAPKSVSLVQALAGDDRIVGVFRRAVEETMKELESEMTTRVRKSGQDTVRLTQNLIWAEFVHFTARPVEGVPDPHLHAHCYVFNATYDGVEGQWKAGKFEEIIRGAPYYEAAFQARLSMGLRDLGYEIRRKGKSFELAGIPLSLVKKFSRRTAQVEILAKQRGIADDYQKSKLGALTREAKTKAYTTEQLIELWKERLTPEESRIILGILGPIAREAARNPQGKGTGQALRTEADALWYAVAHCFERKSVVDFRRFLEQGLRFGVGTVDPGRLMKLAESSKELIFTKQRGQTLVTTPMVLAEERALIEFVRGGRGACPPIAPDHMIQNSALSTEQVEAVRHVLTSRDQVMAVYGRAGTGKTTLIREAVLGMVKAAGRGSHSGMNVVLLAPTSDAAHVVLRKAGFENSETVAMMLASRQLREQYQGGVWWVDEAGLLSVKSMLSVLELAHLHGARVILSGDVRQHGSVDRGDAFRMLVEHGEIKVAALSQIRRQTGDLKRAIELLSRGQVWDGFQKLDELGAIREVDEKQRHKVLAAEYLRILQDGETALVISPTHSEGRKVTNLIRNELKAAGLVERERPVSVLRRLDLTQAERADHRFYEPGMIVQFVKSAPGFAAGERLTITDIPEHQDAKVIVSRPGRATAEIDLRRTAAMIQVFQPEEIGIGQGDKIRITKNGRTLDGRSKLTNGSIETVVGFTYRGDLKLENGRVLPKTYMHIDHGYVTTSHAAQGKTVDRVLIAQGSESFGASSLEQLYVSASRGRKSAAFFTQDREGFFEAIRHSSQRMAAIDLIPERQKLRAARAQSAVVAEQTQSGELALSSAEASLSSQPMTKLAAERSEMSTLVIARSQPPAPYPVKRTEVLERQGPEIEVPM